MSKTLRYAVINSFATAIYIFLIVTLIFYGGQFVFNDDGKETILIPISMLMLFVSSAAITGFLVFGRPIMWYLDGKKHEAIILLFYTLGIFVVLTTIMFTILILYSNYLS